MKKNNELSFRKLSRDEVRSVKGGTRDPGSTSLCKCADGTSTLMMCTGDEECIAVCDAFCHPDVANP